MSPPAQRRSAPDRVLRMLSIVPWIAAQDGPRVGDVCERFGIGRNQLLDDLNVIQFVGLPPYTPDMLIDVVFEGDRVWVRFADVFSRPLRLTPNQALGLVAAGAALVGAGAAGGEEGPPGPLATGLAKLAKMLGIAPDEALSIRLGPSRPEILDTLRAAVAERRRVRLDYFTYSRDARTVREVDPYRVFAADGAWYLFGHCHSAQGERLFRVDRVAAAEPLDVTFTPPEGVEEARPSLLAVAPDTPRVTLELPPDARWVVDTYPVEEVVDLDGGRVRVRLAVTSRAWLARLLLRLGPTAVVVDATDPALRHT
ncbi:MAG TPA: WYL domain-containing protein, partial [Acidimicrobiales bacterium]